GAEQEPAIVSHAGTLAVPGDHFDGIRPEGPCCMLQKGHVLHGVIGHDRHEANAIADPGHDASHLRHFLGVPEILLDHHFAFDTRFTGHRRDAYKVLHTELVVDIDQNPAFRVFQHAS